MIKKLSYVMLSFFLTLSLSNHTITLFPSSDKQLFIDGIKSFETVLKLQDQNVSLITRNLKSDKTIWNNTLDAIKGFVDLNAKQYLTQFNALKNINDALFNKLSINYASNISGRTTFDATAIKNLFQTSPGITTLSSQANTLYTDLSKTVVAALPKTKAVRSVLAQLALTLKNMCTKIQGDLIKLSPATTTPPAPQAMPTPPPVTDPIPTGLKAPFNTYKLSVWNKLGLSTISSTNENLIPYKILGVLESNSPEQIYAVYLKKSVDWHPTKPTGNQDVFNLITAAYEYLNARNKAHPPKPKPAEPVIPTPPPMPPTPTPKISETKIQPHELLNQIRQGINLKSIEEEIKLLDSEKIPTNATSRDALLEEIRKGKELRKVEAEPQDILTEKEKATLKNNYMQQNTDKLDDEYQSLTTQLIKMEFAIQAAGPSATAAQKRERRILNEKLKLIDDILDVKKPNDDFE